MKVFVRSFLPCVLYFGFAGVLWILFRFVGLDSVPAFADFDYESLDHGALLKRAVVAGGLVGTIFFFVSRGLDSPVIRRRPYGVLILLHFLCNVASVLFVLMGLRLVELLSAGEALTVEAFRSRLMSVNFLVLLLYFSLVTFSYFIFREIDRKFGPGNLRKVVAGTFYHPREIELIVMFLDLKDSTTFAERLGHLKFGSLIQDCFIDMSVVTRFDAQFYQYVGDEAILLWDVDRGTAGGSCLQAYFAFQRRLEERREHYQSTYGLFPEFKAGINVGVATVLEVGEIKREISYLGDVLNTAARIQGQCNTHGEKLLISETLRAQLKGVPEHLEIEEIGEAELRGRAEAVGIHRVTERVTTSV